MTRGTMRRILRRRVNDVAAVNWVDSDLDELLNAGLAQAAIDVMKVDPLAFLTFWRTSLVANQEFYAKPVGMQYESMIRLKDTGSGQYFMIRRGDYYQIISRNLSLATPPTNFNSIVPETKYAHVGRNVALNPIPSVAVVDGLEFIGVQTLTMALDTDVTELNLGLHMLPILWAHRFALGETTEALADTNDMIDRLTSQIPQFYRQSAGDPVTLQPDIIKDYGLLDSQ